MSESEQPATRPRCSSRDNGVYLAARRSHEALLQYCY